MREFESRRFFKSAVLAIGLLSSSCSEPKTVDASQSPGPFPANTEIDLSKVQNFLLPYGRSSEPWFIIYGPHFIGNIEIYNNKPVVRNAIDLGPPEVVDCKDKEKRVVLNNRVATASSSGKIIVVGDENNRNDGNHSIVWIETDFGFILAYEHLADISVKKDDRISQGQPLGKLSCEFPKGGDTTGVHLHLAVYDKNFNPVPIEGLKLSGWTIKAGKSVGEGTMTNGKDVKIANGGRCDTPQKCGGLRNDVSHPSLLDRP